MHLAIIGAVAGHAEALRAALEEVADAGIQAVLHPGDSVVGGPEPEQALRLLEAHGAHCVQGAQDRLVARLQRKRASLRRRLSPEDFAALEAAAEALPPEDVEALARRPRILRLEFETLRFTITNGAPSNPRKPLLMHETLARYQREREAALADIIVVGGDSYFSRFVEDTLFICPGRLVEEGSGRVRYVLLDTDAKPWRADLVTAGGGR